MQKAYYQVIKSKASSIKEAKNLCKSLAPELAEKLFYNIVQQSEAPNYYINYKKPLIIFASGFNYNNCN